MLVRITLENWRSFRDPVTFQMVASKERQHGERLARLPRYQARVLPVAAIYGGNASGKTNFFLAVHFARTLIVRGTQKDEPIRVDPFRLDRKSLDAPTRFSFEILVGEQIYEFAFGATSHAVTEERLVQITGSSERVLYDRQGGQIVFDATLKQDHAFLQFAFRGTRANQLFLTNTVSQQLDTFRPVYDWFENTLELIAPDGRFAGIELAHTEAWPFLTQLNELLPLLGTGIDALAGEEVSLANVLRDDARAALVQDMVREGETLRLVGPAHQRIVVSRTAGVVRAQKLVTQHRNADGTSTPFDLAQESDGSQRLIDLLPAFLALSAHTQPRVYLIDELDRSLHTLLTRKLLALYLDTCGPNARSQFVFTTHDLLLMDQDLLRRDEMWVTERDLDGSSSLYSFSEFRDVRYDKDIRKSYLEGRLGGTPRLRVTNGLRPPRAKDPAAQEVDGAE